jgi:hypothetical protein
MSMGSFDLTETQEADNTYAQAVRNVDALDDLKQRIALAFTQWLYANQVTLKPEVEKPSWAHSFADTPEGLTEYRLAFFNDVVDDMHGTFEVAS